MLFCNELREKLKRENPGTAITVQRSARRLEEQNMRRCRRYETEKSDYDSGTETIPAMLQKSGATPSKQLHKKANTSNAQRNPPCHRQIVMMMMVTTSVFRPEHQVKLSDRDR